MKKIFAFLLICGICISLTACGSARPEEKAAMHLTIGTMPSIDKVPILVAEEKGFFDKYGLDVTIENFQSPTDRNAALQAGELDGLMTDMVAFPLYLDAGLDLKMTSSIQTEFAILASQQSGIKSLDDISSDASCGIALNCLMEYIADAAGTENKILLPDVMARVEQILNGSIDLTIVPEPYGEMAVQQGAVYLGSAEDLGIDTAVMAFTAETLEQKSKAVEAFYSGCFDAIGYLADADSGEWLDGVIKAGEFSDNAGAFLAETSYKPLAAPSKEQFDGVQAWMSTKPDFKGPYHYNFDEVTDFSFLR